MKHKLRKIYLQNIQKNILNDIKTLDVLYIENVAIDE